MKTIPLRRDFLESFVLLFEMMTDELFRHRDLLEPEQSRATEDVADEVAHRS